MVNPLRNFVPKRRKPVPPEDFEDADDFLQFFRETFQNDLDADKHNREEALLDQRFFAGYQWDEDVLKARRAAGKPSLVINRLVAFVGQLVGNRRLNAVSAKITPDKGGTREEAEIREGLIRMIQKNSRADRVYNRTFQDQVVTGIGNFQISIDFADNDVFEQDITIVPIANPLAVVWDYRATDPTGADATHVSVVDTLPRKEFERRYPQARIADIANDPTLGFDLRSQGWVTTDDVRVVSFWRMRSEPRLLMLNINDEVEDITEADDPDEVLLERAARDPVTGDPIIRESERRFAEMYLVTGADILEGPYRLPITRVPVFRAEGWSAMVGDRRERWGLVRFLRDSQKLHNYWRSTVAEKLMRAPKAKFKIADTAIQGREDSWRKAHISDDPVLIWNADSGHPPEEIPPAQIEAALVTEANMAAQDIRDISNIQEAALGIQSNEVSGRAIIARQRVAELGTIIYQDHMNAAIEEMAIVINQLIPVVFDTARTIKILEGDEGAERERIVRINDVVDESVDITSGKYSVTVTTGPSFVTKRIEASEAMLNMVNAMPQTMAIAADKIIEAQDWPGAQEIARRLRMTMDPLLLREEDIPEEVQEQLQARAQAQLAQQQMQQALLQAELAEKQARAIEAQARAQQAQALAAKAISEIGARAEDIGIEAERNRLREFEIAVKAFNEQFANQIKAFEAVENAENNDLRTMSQLFTDHVNRVNKLFGDRGNGRG